MTPWILLYSRVQWFWNFVRNSICFMCFWFGLEILRLVYKNRFLKYWMASILFDLLSSEKSSTAPHKSWKKISSKLGIQGIKRSGILHWFQKCEEVLCSAKGKKIYRKTEFWRTFFAKNHFSEKKSLGTSWRKSSTHFWNQRKIPLLLISFAPTL